jgi:hypothetical protein
MRPRARRAFAALLTGGVVVVVGWLIAGLVGIVVSLAALAVIVTLGPRWVAGAALVAFVTAGVATVVVPLPNDLATKPNFAQERPVASESARVAGVLVAAAIAGFAARERERGTGSTPAVEASLPETGRDGA